MGRRGEKSEQHCRHSCWPSALGQPPLFRVVPCPVQVFALFIPSELALRPCFGQEVSLMTGVLALLRAILKTSGYGQGQLNSEKTNSPDDRHLYW